MLEWSEGEPIPFAQVLWYSADGRTWSAEGLGDAFGGAGSMQVAMAAERVVVAFGHEQAQGGGRPSIDDPAWWVGTSQD